MKQRQYEELAYASSDYRVSMSSLPMLSPHPTTLRALARLLPSAADRVLLQQRYHLVITLLFRELLGSTAPPILYFFVAAGF